MIKEHILVHIKGEVDKLLHLWYFMAREFYRPEWSPEQAWKKLHISIVDFHALLVDTCGIVWSIARFTVIESCSPPRSIWLSMPNDRKWYGLVTISTSDRFLCDTSNVGARREVEARIAFQFQDGRNTENQTEFPPVLPPLVRLPQKRKEIFSDWLT